jgi:UDP-N-acetylglucosamine--N-acetylmuramyl-(pentapeptide) pyrophosphoryl-undecaprenol N-acetylglucosamine transferase
MIVLTCSGTGGHVYPAIAVAQYLKTTDLLFVINKGRIAEKIIQDHSFPYLGLEQTETSFLGILRAFAKMYRFFRQNTILNVYSFGGKTTLPVVLAARINRIPITLFEQNAIPGRANRFLSKFATTMCLSSPASQPFFSKKALLTGNPIRSHYLPDTRLDSMLKLNWKEGTRCLVVGGSQGAAGINLFIASEYSWFEHNNIQLIHIVGEHYYNEHFPKTPYYAHKTNDRTNYVVVPFITDMKTAYEWANYVISRAGATTIAELKYYNKRALVIPYPYATDNHQNANANDLCNENTAISCEQEKLTRNTLKTLFQSPPLPPQTIQHQETLNQQWQHVLQN